MNPYSLGVCRGTQKITVEYLNNFQYARTLREVPFPSLLLCCLIGHLHNFAFLLYSKIKLHNLALLDYKYVVMYDVTILYFTLTILMALGNKCWLNYKLKWILLFLNDRVINRQNQPMLLFPLHIKISYEGIDVQYYPHGL